MDPMAVLKTLWRHRLLVLPMFLATLLAALYVYEFAPRSYESSMTYALVNPSIPSEAEKLKDPALEALNPDNPYLRSSDQTLIIQVLTSRMNARSIGKQLAADGLSDDFMVARAQASSGFLVDIVAVADSKEKSLHTTQALGSMLVTEVKSMQKVNGADDIYLFSPIVVVDADDPQELYSNRLRSIVIVFIAGVVLVLGAVSIGRGLENSRTDRKSRLNYKGRSKPRRVAGAKELETKAKDQSTVESPAEKTPRTVANSRRRREEPRLPKPMRVRMLDGRRIKDESSPDSEPIHRMQRSPR